jgi:hypothetical protein
VVKLANALAVVHSGVRGSRVILVTRGSAFPGVGVMMDASVRNIPYLDAIIYQFLSV